MENEENQNLNINQPPAPQQPIVEPEKLSLLESKWIKIGAVVVAIILVLSLTFILGKNSANNSSVTPTPTPSDMTGSGKLTPVEPKSGATADWKTYTNTKHNYSFRLPNSFSIVKGPSEDLPDSEFQKVDGIAFDGMQDSSDPNAGVEIGIQVNPSDANDNKISCSSNNDCLNKWVQVLKKSPNQINSVSKIIANQNTKGIEYENNNDLYSQTAVYYAIFQDNKFYLISLVLNNYSKNEVEKTLDQILSTFKFTDSSADTSTWKTYTNTKNKVQLKYPVNYLVEEDLGQDSSHDVYFFSSASEKAGFDKCRTDNVPECNNYSLALKFDNKNKPQTKSLETSIKEDFYSDPTNYQSLEVAGYPALQDQFEGIGIVNNTFINRGSSVFHVFANSITDKNTNIQIYKNMLTTFKFTQ